jgi:2-oxoacid:acceptor oxidoreductase gamma subunit (pyruvate/2-ketoisovalerate family)
MIEIKFKGRGGQGAVIASEILGRAFFLEDKYPQCFSVFGAERRGAPVIGFLRIDDEPILLKCQIKRPNHLILLDLSLTDSKEIGQEIVPGGKLLINTCNSIEYFKDLRGFTIGLVDAASIARNLGLGGNFNMAMLGAYVRLTNLIRLETLIEAVTRMVPSKREENIRAVRDAYEQVKIYEAHL